MDINTLTKEQLRDIVLKQESIIEKERERCKNLSRQLRTWKQANIIYNNPLDLADRGLVEKFINGGLKMMLHDHGPMTRENYSSASKRVYGKLKELAFVQRRGMRDGH